MVLIVRLRFLYDADVERQQRRKNPRNEQDKAYPNIQILPPRRPQGRQCRDQCNYQADEPCEPVSPLSADLLPIADHPWRVVEHDASCRPATDAPMCDKVCELSSTRFFAACTATCARATAHRARGLVEHDADMLIEAARQLRDTPRLVEFAATCEDAAAALVDHGRNKEAIELAAEAGRTYEAIGARGHLARTDAALTALGVKRHKRATPASSGWESLTAKELEVVELIADSLSNPQIANHLFISRRTVETHLAHIFRKLTIGNRTHPATTAVGRGRCTARAKLPWMFHGLWPTSQQVVPQVGVARVVIRFRVGLVSSRCGFGCGSARHRL